MIDFILNFDRENKSRRRTESTRWFNGLPLGLITHE
jgi:hypothetical protein